MERWLTCCFLLSTLAVEQVISTGESCGDAHPGCEDGYYCCNFHSGSCCPQDYTLSNNEFYTWVLIVSGIAVTLFVVVMSCYWCTCCPMYNRERPSPETAAVNSRSHQRSRGHRHEQSEQGAPYLIQPVDGCDLLPTQCPQQCAGVPPLPQQATGHTLAPPYTTQHLPLPTEPCGEAPPYSRYPAPSQGHSIPLYQMVQPPGDQYIPLTLPVYPDEPPPRYTP